MERAETNLESLINIIASLDPWYNQGRPQVSLLACMKRAVFLGRYIASRGGRVSCFASFS